MRRAEIPGREDHCGFKSRLRHFYRSDGNGIRTCLKSRVLRVRIPSPVLTQISADMQTELKQAVCKTVAFGPCGFKSLSADLYAAVPQWWRSCLEGFWSVIPACGFDPRLWRYTGMCANRAGSLSRKQVIRKGLGVRIPPSPLLSRSGRIGKCTCLLSRGRLIRHPGSGPGSGVLNDAAAGGFAS